MAAENIDFKNPQYYINRELSWIEFDRRCLSEARNKENPLFERLKFLSITASNLDEFFQVRVASLQDMVQAGYKKKDFAGFTATGQLNAVLSECQTFMQQQYWTLNRQIIPDLEEQGLVMVRDLDTLTKGELRFVEEYFSTTVFPVLTPMAVDSSRPFPLIANKSLNIGALLTRKETSAPGILAPRKKPKKAGKNEKDKGEKIYYEFATVQVPGVLPRILLLPGTEGAPKRIVLLEDVIRRFLPMLFVNYEVKCSCPYRVLRSADFDISEDQTEDLLKEITTNGDEMTIASEAIPELAFIMAKQADKADMMHLEYATYIEWLELFNPFDLALNGNDIFMVYVADAVPTEEPKKKARGKAKG